jgi:hypothetical protein
VGGCPRFTGDLPQAAARALEDLTVGRCPASTFTGAGVRRLPSLVSLTVYAGTGFTAGALAGVSACCPRLTRITVSSPDGAAAAGDVSAGGGGGGAVAAGGAGVPLDTAAAAAALGPGWAFFNADTGTWWQATRMLAPAAGGGGGGSDDGDGEEGGGGGHDEPAAKRARTSE